MNDRTIEATAPTLVRDERAAVINRGAEKIDAREIDAVLMRHPAVAEAAAFAVSDQRLGEDVAAAVVLRPGAKVASVAVRRFARTWIASSKVPRRIYFVASLPKAADGKVQRARLTETFVNTPSGDPTALLRAKLETELVALWRVLLQRPDLSIDDNWFDSGGDHRIAIRMLIEAQQIAGGAIPESILFDAPTARELVDCIIEPGGLERVLFIPVRAGANGRPIFFMEGEFGRGGGYFVRKLATLLGPDQAFYNLRPYAALSGPLPSYEQMAAGYVSIIKSVQPKGPYRLGGHCNGAILAIEVAHQLRAGGDEIELVAMIEPYSMNARWPLRLLLRTLKLTVPLVIRDPERARARIGRLMRRAWLTILEYDKKKRVPGAGPSYDAYYHPNLPPLSEEIAAHLANETAREAVQNLIPLSSYLPRATDTRILCFVSEESSVRLRFKSAPWKPHFRNLEILNIPGGHFSCFAKHVDPLAKLLRERLNPRG